MNFSFNKTASEFLLKLVFLCVVLSCMVSCSKDGDMPIDETENNYNGSNNNSSSNGVSSSIVSQFIHLYRSDGQKMIVEHLNAKAGLIVNSSFISYKDGYAPEYKYSKSGKSGSYYLMWTPTANGLLGGIRHYLEVKLTFNSNERGTFIGTTWYEGWNLSTNEQYKKGETSCKGTFYIGKKQDPNNNNNNNNSNNNTNNGGEPTTPPGVVKTIELGEISNITSNSATIKGTIEIEGNYEEKGIVCVSFANSLGAYGFSLPSTPELFKKSYGSNCIKTTSNTFNINASNLKSKTFYMVKAYAITGDKLTTSDSKSFTTR